MATIGRGGKRNNAGRKKGQPGQKTKARVEVVEKALDAGLSPLEYMLSILRNEEIDQKERFAAAMAAAPYLHPRLAAVEHSGNQEKPLGVLMGLLSEIDGKTRGIPPRG